MTRRLHFPPLELVCQAALLIMFWLSFCTRFKVGREVRVSYVSPALPCKQGSRETEIHGASLCYGPWRCWDRAVSRADKNFLFSRSSPPSSAFYTREMEGSEKAYGMSRFLTASSSFSISLSWPLCSLQTLNFPGISLLVLPILALPFLLPMLLPKRSS